MLLNELLTRAFLGAAALGLVLHSHAASNWPVVNEVELRIGVEALADRIYLELPVMGRRSQYLYRLICRGGSEKYLDEFNAETGIVVAPVLNCALYDKGENEDSLLSEDGSPAWHTRGQIHLTDFNEPCASYPEYGLRRNFSLRGMRLMIKIENVVKNRDGGLKRYDVLIVIKNDPQSFSRRARFVGFNALKYQDCSNDSESSHE